jgi:hypothetical protein
MEKTDILDTLPIIVSAPRDVRRELAALGLTPKIVWETGVRWARAEAMESAFEPRNAPGLKGWIAGTGYFREQTRLAGCIMRDPYGIPISYNEKLGISLSVTSGNPITGLVFLNKQPMTKNAKGAATVTRILKNASQLEMWAPSQARPGVLRVAGKPPKKPVTDLIWLVLVFVDTEHDVIRVEVSLPRGIVGRRVNLWTKRILVADPGNRPEAQKSHDDDADDDVDVRVQRKA